MNIWKNNNIKILNTKKNPQINFRTGIKERPPY